MEDRVVDSDLPVIVNVGRQPAGSGVAGEPGLDGMPPGARRDFPRLEVPCEKDFQVIEHQLGRPPRGEAFIAFRCELGRPAVILNLPDQGAGRTVPPLLWLSCPHQVREVSRMESRGTMRGYSERLRRKEPGDREKLLFQDEEERFGRIQALLLEGRIGASVEELRNRGVAGGRPGAVKCLHAHLAYRLASGRGVIGGWCLEELDNGGGRMCETIPQTCLA